jgi:Est1 DNA/RNA binding domain
MAIEDDDVRDREVWTSVSRHWYSRASDKAPTTGRLYHHLAILARPNALQQLFYYAKSLCVPIPFLSAKESIMTLFDPILNIVGSSSRMAPIDLAFVRAHGILFSGKVPEKLDSSVTEFLESLDNHISRITRHWMEFGYYIGIALCCALLEYGDESNVLLRAIKPQRLDDAVDTHMEGTESSSPGKRFHDALNLTMRTHEIVFRRFGDPNILPYLHVALVFIHHMSGYQSAMATLEHKFPWKLTSLMLNTLLTGYQSYDRIESLTFPLPENGDVERPLPEDFAMRGLLFVDKYYRNDFFSNLKIDDDEKYFEQPSMTEERKERVLWLGCRIADAGLGLLYDKNLRQFAVTEQYEHEIDGLPLRAGAEDAMLSEETEAPIKTPKQTAAGDDLDIPDAPTLTS